MKSLRLCFIACLAGHLCFGQNPCTDLTKTPATAEAYAALAKIIGAVGFNSNTIFLYASSDGAVADKGGAMSLACALGGAMDEKWIVYDPQIIKGAAARDFVFAHEVAHHANGRPQSTAKWTAQDELQADYNGAQYLVRLGWTKQQLLSALDALNLPQGSVQGYPTVAERRQSVTNGYDFEKALITPPPQDSRIRDSLQRAIDGRRPISTKTYIDFRHQLATKTDTLRFTGFAQCKLEFQSLYSWSYGIAGGQALTVPISVIEATDKACNCKSSSAHFVVHLAVTDGTKSIEYEYVGADSLGGHDKYLTDSFDLFSADKKEADAIVATLNRAILSCKK